MDTELLNKLLAELSATRTSFDETQKSFAEVVKTIKWTRRNTIIQYCLIVVVAIMMVLAGYFYLHNRREDCLRGNQFRSSVNSALDNHALAIGVAVAAVAGGNGEDIEDYMGIYLEQPKAEVLEPRSC